MPTLDFASCFVRLDFASHEVARARDLFSSYTKIPPFTFVEGPLPEQRSSRVHGKAYYFETAEPLPQFLLEIIGSAIARFRSSLELAMGEIARTEGIAPKSTPSFPIPQKADRMKAAVDHLKISEAWKDRIRGLPMFRDFDPIPAVMHNLRNQDMHRHALLSVPRAVNEIEFKGSGTAKLFILYQSVFNKGDLAYVFDKEGDIEPIIWPKLLLHDPDTNQTLDAWEMLAAFEDKCREILTWLREAKP